MRRNRILNFICVILVLLIIGIIGITFYNIFIVDYDEDIPSHAEKLSYSVDFELNGADFIEKSMMGCDTNLKCTITLPVATRKNGVVLGYSKSAVAVTPEYGIGDEIDLDLNMTLYVISYKENNVTIESNGVDYLEEEEVSCKAFNKEKSCIIKLPAFNKLGYENRGYSTSSTSLVGFVFPNEEYKISKDIKLYPVYGVNNHLVSLKIDNVFTYQKSFIEIEKGCGEDVYSKYLDYIKEISDEAPFLLLGNKITFVSDDSFDSIWGTQYVGMNYGPYSARSLDVRCSYRIYNDYYGTMVHEMTHSWDFFYGTRMDGNISSQNDFINLYNKYSALTDRPFRDYSYSNKYEFLADAFKYYYFKYSVPKAGFKELEFPDDIKKTLEKYICIAKNNYEEKGCV